MKLTQGTQSLGLSQLLHQRDSRDKTTPVGAVPFAALWKIAAKRRTFINLGFCGTMP
jgi:hypothetical protein